MVLIVQLGNSLAQRLDTGGRTILSRSDRYVDARRAGEAASNVILNLGRALAQVGPGVGVLEEAVLGGALGAPDYTGGGAAGVEAGVRLVAFVRVAELTVDLGLELCRCAILSALCVKQVSESAHQRDRSADVDAGAAVLRGRGCCSYRGLLDVGEVLEWR